jgi:hypothetical protein
VRALLGERVRRAGRARGLGVGGRGHAVQKTARGGEPGRDSAVMEPRWTSCGRGGRVRRGTGRAGGGGEARLSIGRQGACTQGDLGRGSEKCGVERVATLQCGVWCGGRWRMVRVGERAEEASGVAYRRGINESGTFGDFGGHPLQHNRVAAGLSGRAPLLPLLRERRFLDRADFPALFAEFRARCNRHLR